MGLGGVRYWVKKAGAVLRVPRQTHARPDPAQVEEFRRTFARRLCALALPKEQTVRVMSTATGSSPPCGEPGACGACAHGRGS